MTECCARNPGERWPQLGNAGGCPFASRRGQVAGPPTPRSPPAPTVSLGHFAIDIAACDIQVRHDEFQAAEIAEILLGNTVGQH